MDAQLGSPPGTTVAELAATLGSQGWVVLPDRLPAQFVAELAAAFGAVLDRHLAGADPNRGVNRHQAYVPFEPPFSDPALWGQPTVLAVLDAVLGPDFECTYYGSDTPFPGAEHQPAHQDGAPLFPGWDVTPPPYSIALNVPLVDVDEANGPLELFPGPHQPDPAAEPLRCTLPAGGILLRDARVWHRGSPNVGAAPRPMLALLYTRPWYRFVLDRPAITAEAYAALPDPGRRLFRGADRPRSRATGDRPRLAVAPPPAPWP
ncbi:MAG: phytanoyl-CoA dioxygenase family protein [Acidimicrobiales bacterium]